MIYKVTSFSAKRSHWVYNFRPSRCYSVPFGCCNSAAKVVHSQYVQYLCKDRDSMTLVTTNLWVEIHLWHVSYAEA